MKNAIRSILFLMFAGASICLADIIAVQPASQTVNLGNFFSVDVIGDVTDLYSFQFDITFDPTKLSATEPLDAGFLQLGGTTAGFFAGFVDNATGTIVYTGNSLIGDIPGVTGSGPLATVYFTAIGAGTSPIDLSNIILLDHELNDIAAQTTNGSVDVLAPSGSVPDPASLAAFGGVLLAVLAMSRRRLA